MGIPTARERQESAKNSGTLLKGQQTKFCLWPLTLGSGRRGGGLEGTKVVQRQTELYGFSERDKGLASKAPVLSPSPTLPTDGIFPESSTPLHTASASGNALASPSLWPHLLSSHLLEETTGCGQAAWPTVWTFLRGSQGGPSRPGGRGDTETCLLYTSDAADELITV